MQKRSPAALVRQYLSKQCKLAKLKSKAEAHLKSKIDTTADVIVLALGLHNALQQSWRKSLSWWRHPWRAGRMTVLKTVCFKLCCCLTPRQRRSIIAVRRCRSLSSGEWTWKSRSFIYFSRDWKHTVLCGGIDCCHLPFIRGRLVGGVCVGDDVQTTQLWKSGFWFLQELFR